MFVNDHIFEHMKAQDKHNGVFLFVSNNKEYLREASLAFGRSLLDFSEKDIPLNERVWEPEGGQILLESIDEFIEFESKSAVGVRSKLLIIHDVECIASNVSDKLLKTIEDFNKDSLIILTTTDLLSVSPTIRSRSMVFRSFTDSSNFYVAHREDYLGFIDKLPEETFYSLDDVVDSVVSIGIFNVIQALFENISSEFDLYVAEKSLNLYLTSTRDSYIARFIIYKYFMYTHDIISKDLLYSVI